VSGQINETLAYWDDAQAQTIIDRMAGLDGAVLPMLHALQDEFGYVDDKAVPLIADALNLSRAEIYGTISFYHDFRRKPAEGRIIKLCRAEACQASGCEGVKAVAETHLGVKIDSGAGKNGVSLETIYCLGNCALGPAALVDGELIGRVDDKMIRTLCDEACTDDVLSLQEAQP